MSKSHSTHDNKQEKEKVVSKSNQPLILEDICPIWANKMKRGLNQADKFIMSHDSKYCLVGEAWGFSGRQAGYYIAPLIPLLGCWRCVIYGYNMGKICRKEELNTSELEAMILNFLKHWNEKHITITDQLQRKGRIGASVAP
jgi:hypothetical protein